MNRRIWNREEVVAQLRELGLVPGSVALVHCAFGSVGPIAGGPRGLIDALLAALEPDGTLVMPSMMDDEEQPFDPRTTPCLGMGIVAHTFWQQPGVLRSDSPHAFAAYGPHAARITAAHPVDLPHGPDSPVGRVLDLDGQILLLGVGHDADTTIHLAEWLAGVRYRRTVSVLLRQAGRVVRFPYREIDHCCQNFNLVDGWLDARGLQRRGRVGHAEARLLRSRDLVAVVTERLRRDETTFLHPTGVDEECDEARASLAGLAP